MRCNVPTLVRVCTGGTNSVPRMHAHTHGLGPRRQPPRARVVALRVRVRAVGHGVRASVPRAQLGRHSVSFASVGAILRAAEDIEQVLYVR